MIYPQGLHYYLQRMLTLSKFPRSVNSVDLEDFIDVKREQQNCRINERYIAYGYTFNKNNNNPIKCTLFFNSESGPQYFLSLSLRNKY